jgi:hypothetical protein
MKRPYQRPEIVEYGPVNQLTLGSNGPKSDILIIIDLRAPTPTISTTPNTPATCDNKWPGSAIGCYKPVIKW